MQVSNNTNNYQDLNAQQKYVTTPVMPKEDPTYNNKEIYEASQGNLIRSDEDVVLTPQGQNNIDNKKAENASETAAAEQAQKDQQRENGADYLAHKSMQSQVEIYLAVATDGNVDMGDDKTPSIIESLRDVQKQNNAVEAYATYEENQKGGRSALY